MFFMVIRLCYIMAMVNQTGTLEWARQTGGRLDRKGLLQQLAMALVSQLKTLPAQLRWRLGLSRATVTCPDIASLRVPDSTVARSAEELSNELSPYIVNHSLRTYLWAKILAGQDRIKHDEELLYIACLLHDIGLGEKFAGKIRGARCFTIESAEAAINFARDEGWADERQHALADAITLHMNVKVDLEQGHEAHLLHEGAAFDVIGSRYWEIAPETIQAVIDRHPRLGFKQAFISTLSAQAACRPGSRAHFLCSYLMFNQLIKIAPFAE
jgi:hypothetical protein